MLAIGLAIGPAASADDRVAAVASDGGDVRTAVLVGAQGQVYEPDGKGAWARRTGGGVGDAVDTAIQLGSPGGLVAGAASSATAHAPPYRFRDHAWTALHLVLKTKAVVARGSRAIAASGKQVWALDRSAGPTPLPDAPGPVEAIGATAGGGVVIETDHGLWRLDGRSWRALTSAPQHVDAFAGDRWALVPGGAVDLREGKTVSWPAQAVLTVAAPGPSDALVAAGIGGAGIDVVVIRGTKLERDTAPLPPPTGGAHPVVAGVALDRDGRIIVALRDGHVVSRDRDGKTWSTTEVTDALPPAHAGSPPATSR